MRQPIQDIMISGSKAFFHDKLACQWEIGIMTRPTWSTKWGFIPAKVRNVGGAWEHEVRNAPDITF